MTTTTARFPHHTVDSAPERSQSVLRAQQEKFGFVASPLARMAESPALLEAAIRILGSFEQSSLSHAEREVVAFTMAYDNDCTYCMAMHSALAMRVPELKPEIERLRSGALPADARLAVLSAFVRSVVVHHGNVPAEERETFTAAGFTVEQALDVVLGVAAYTLTTFTNHLTGAPLDAAFERFRWSKVPAQRPAA